MTHTEIIKKLIGPVRPIGESNADAARLKNLKAMFEVVDDLLSEIRAVSENKDSHESSVRTAGRYADVFLKEKDIK